MAEVRHQFALKRHHWILLKARLLFNAFSPPPSQSFSLTAWRKPMIAKCHLRGCREDVVVGLTLAPTPQQASQQSQSELMGRKGVVKAQPFA
jgi:hypothetical protein